ncbi:DUF4197 domain-containing protein [Hymenobacter algoricola]|uniref:DUF4197 domain-containing protein n=1 Tax=Hymenobacter algoricola TaxID=486267 RepID=A0ABP7NJX4_9BACT
MTRFRILLAVAALSLAGAPALQAQTKKTTTTTKKTTARKPVVKKPVAKPATTTKTTVKTTVPVVPVLPPLTADIASAALHEALTTSITKAVAEASAPDGFNANADIRLATPPEAELVSTTLRTLRLGALVDNFEVALNHAAEAASAEAKPIFVNAIQNITFNDALSLLTSREPDAATLYLNEKTSPQLVAAFTPIMQASLEKAGATKLYAEMVARYNKIPLVTKLDPSLTTYATQQTVNGLFSLMAAEEGRIRLNPAARTSELLSRTFGRSK